MSLVFGDKGFNAIWLQPGWNLLLGVGRRLNSSLTQPVVTGIPAKPQVHCNKIDNGSHETFVPVIIDYQAFIQLFHTILFMVQVQSAFIYKYKYSKSFSSCMEFFEFYSTGK